MGKNAPVEFLGKYAGNSPFLQRELKIPFPFSSVNPDGRESTN